MFGIGSTELLIIVVVALIVIGPKKLPEMMRTLGKGLAEFKSMGSDVKRTLDREIEQAEQDIRTATAKEKLFKEEKEKTEDASPEEGDKADGASQKTEADSPDSSDSSKPVADKDAEPTVGKESA